MRCSTPSALAAITLWAALAQPMSAQITVDFDEFTGMHFLGGIVPAESRLSNQLAASGVTFSTTNGADFVGIANLISGSPQPHAPSNPNGIGGATTVGTLSYGVAGRPIRATFNNPSNPFQPATASFVSVGGDLRGNGAGNTAYLVAYDQSGGVLATVSQPDVAGPFLSISIPGIRTVEMYSGDGSIAFDNLTFGELLPVAIESRTWSTVKDLYRR